MSTETRRPDGAGSEEAVSAATSGAGSHHLDVDEASADDDTTKVWHATGGTWGRDLYSVQDTAVGAGTINKITVWARCRLNSGTNQAFLKLAIKSGATQEDSLAKTVADANYANYSNDWAADPNADGWTWAAINALEIGVNLYRDTIYVFCTQVWVVVDYDEITAAPGGSPTNLLIAQGMI